MKPLIFTLFFFVSVLEVAFPLDPEKAITQYIHDAWGKEQGLPQMSARYLVQTNDGYLWIGTTEGLARFDGVRFKNFAPQNEPVFKSGWIQEICKDRDGTLWIGTREKDLIHYKNGEFVDYAFLIMFHRICPGR